MTMPLPDALARIAGLRMILANAAGLYHGERIHVEMARPVLIEIDDALAALVAELAPEVTEEDPGACALFVPYYARPALPR